MTGKTRTLVPVPSPAPPQTSNQLPPGELRPGPTSRGAATRTFPLLKFMAMRFGLAGPVVLAIVVISFLLTRITPGDPVTALVGDYPASQEYVDALRKSFGLDQPFYAQLWLYLSNMLRGNFGYSFFNKSSVIDLVFQRTANTLALMIPALLFATLIGISLPLLAVRRAGGLLDRSLSMLVLGVDAVPIFWLGQMLTLLFAVDLQWLPAQGMFSLRGHHAMTFVDFLLHWILPGLAVTLAYSVTIARVARASIGEMLNQDFVTTALAKGLTESQVLRRHVLPNALLPVATVIGHNIGHAVVGAILTEAVFGWPGLGGLLVTSIATRDYPVLQGIFLLTSVSVVLANLATDVAYAVIDPRVRYVDSR